MLISLSHPPNYQYLRKTRDLYKTALVLSLVTVGYNIIEGILSLFIGIISDSIALTSFGLDSFVESLSGGIMIWRFTRHETISAEKEQEIETRSVRLVSYTFFIFGFYILYESLLKLYLQEKPDPSLFGIIIAVISSLTMPVLFYLKYRTGKALGSKGLIADSKETLACTFLSLSLLIGLGINYRFGIWWADTVVGLIVVFFLFREGIETISDDTD